MDMSECENAHAYPRLLLRQALRKHYPQADKEDEAMPTMLRQPEEFSEK